MKTYGGLRAQLDPFFMSALDTGVVRFNLRPYYPVEKAPLYLYSFIVDRRLVGIPRQFERFDTEKNCCFCLELNTGCPARRLVIARLSIETFHCAYFISTGLELHFWEHWGHHHVEDPVSKSRFRL
jgi:hypothetical protein